MVSDCIFCKIVAGDIPASKVYEDEHFLAFLDISQVTAGHTLVIPKNMPATYSKWHLTKPVNFSRLFLR